MLFKKYAGSVLWQNYIKKWLKIGPQKPKAMMEIPPAKKTKTKMNSKHSFK